VKERFIVETAVDGETLGIPDTTTAGASEGLLLGVELLAKTVGPKVGIIVSTVDGEKLGATVGTIAGASEGFLLGVELLAKTVGLKEGFIVGI
jgi:hypothetical protein